MFRSISSVTLSYTANPILQGKSLAVRRIQERSADFPVRSNMKKTECALFFEARRTFQMAADWKVQC